MGSKNKICNQRRQGVISVLPRSGQIIRFPVSNLAGQRAIMIWATRSHTELLSIDIEAAYLQTFWPTNCKANWIRLRQGVINLLPSTSRTTTGLLEKPMCLMPRCNYGRPRSNGACNICGRHKRHRMCYRSR